MGGEGGKGGEGGEGGWEVREGGRGPTEAWVPSLPPALPHYLLYLFKTL